MRRAVLWFLPALALAAAGGAESGTPLLALQAGDDTVLYGEPVVLILRNDGTGRLEGRPTLVVRDEAGAVLFAPPEFNGETLRLGAGDRAFARWDGTGPGGEPASWGNYSARATLAGQSAEASFVILRPPARAVNVTTGSREYAVGANVDVHVNNNGDLWVNGTISFTVVLQCNETGCPQSPVAEFDAGGRILLAPGGHYDTFWDGKTRSGSPAGPGTYRIQALANDEARGPVPAENWFRLT
ncbi:MAG: hypothetical protein ACT4PT_06635 [Methanobacteriota archaeon]